MKDNKPVRTFESIVNSEVKCVEKILFDIKCGKYRTKNLPFILRGKTDCEVEMLNSRYIISFSDGHKEYITINADNHQLIVQGEWWYKGVYSLLPMGGQTLIKLEIFNHAKRYRWAASLMILMDTKNHEQKFVALISELESEIKRIKQ